MPERLRCAVIGVGGIGLDHLHSLATCPRARAVAFAESDLERAKEAEERFNIPRSYSDYRELLEQPDIDAVTVALPNHLHAPVALAALRARKHVFLEKPMATSLKEATAIVETAKKMKRTVMVGQPLRFRRETQTARAFIERGNLGEVYHARAFWHRRSGIPRIGSWFTQKKLAGGGCLYDLGVPLLDACLHLFGEFAVTAVSAQTFAKFGPRGLGEMAWGKSPVDPTKPFDVEDTAVAFLKLRSGRTLTLDVSWAGHHAPEGREYGIDLLGTEAGLSLFPARLFKPGAGGYEAIELAVAKVPHLEDRLHHFAGCVLDGKKPPVTDEQSLHVQKVLAALYTSAANGREVRL